MPDLKFQVVTAEPEPYAVGPILKFKLHVTQSAATGAEVRSNPSVTLQCQIRIDPGRRAVMRPRNGKVARSVRQALALGPDA